MFAQRLKFLRKEAKMTQEELGEKIGTTKQTIYKYEKGEVENIKLVNIKKLVKLFNVSADYLLGIEETK